MSTCTQMLDKVEKMDVDLLMQIAMEETATTAVRVQQDQLFQGLRSDETYLPDYAPSSVRAGKPPGPIRLYDKGDFYKGFLLDVRNDIFIMGNADYKYPMLRIRYNENIVGLGTDAKNKWIKTLEPVFIKLCERELL